MHTPLKPPFTYRCADTLTEKERERERERGEGEIVSERDLLQHMLV